MANPNPLLPFNDLPVSGQLETYRDSRDTLCAAVHTGELLGVDRDDGDV